MENIYKIKIRSNPDPRGLYPSERRYSASTVLGLGVVHLALAATALLLASLSLTSNKNELNPLINVHNNPLILNSNRQEGDLEKNIGLELERSTESLISVTKSVMSEETKPTSDYNNNPTSSYSSSTSSYNGNPTSSYNNNPTISSNDNPVRDYSSENTEINQSNSQENLETSIPINPTSSFRAKRSNNQRFLEINHNDKEGNYSSENEDFYKNFNPYTNLSLAPCVMSLGALAAGLAGLLAWKRWYIDHNIRWFFFMSIISTLTSFSCVIITTIAIINLHEYSQMSYYNQETAEDAERLNNKLEILNEHYLKILHENNIKPEFVITNQHAFKSTQEQYFDYNEKKPNVRFILALNILISCVLEVMWSILSAKIGFKGMRNTYPDDIVISRNRGKIEVNTVHKGNKKGRIAPPDILNHFPEAGKLAKYFPKIESGGNLPKAESNSEYQERVRQFLSSNNTDDSSSDNK